MLKKHQETAQRLIRAQQPWLSQEPSYSFMKLKTQQQWVKTQNQNDRNRLQAINSNGFTSMPRPRDMLQNSYSRNSVSTEDVHGPSESRRSTRARKVKSFGDDFHLYLVEGSGDEIEYQYQYCFIIEDDPKTFSEARTSRDVALWKEVIQDEMDSIMNNNTWELSDLPPGCKALGNKWIFKRKMNVDGTIDKFNARLVIQGFRQKEGIDYFDTYALVARTSTIRLLIALAAIHSLVIHQMDVKTAFFNGELDEEIYMKQPEGFVMPGYENKTSVYIENLMLLVKEL
ncbi:hypothetical protein AgCh_027234 [Apium graveolens]